MYNNYILIPFLILFIMLLFLLVIKIFKSWNNSTNISIIKYSGGIRRAIATINSTGTCYIIAYLDDIFNSNNIVNYLLATYYEKVHNAYLIVQHNIESIMDHRPTSLFNVEYDLFNEYYGQAYMNCRNELLETLFTIYLVVASSIKKSTPNSRIMLDYIQNHIHYIVTKPRVLNIKDMPPELQLRSKNISLTHFIPPYAMINLYGIYTKFNYEKKIHDEGGEDSDDTGIRKLEGGEDSDDTGMKIEDVVPHINLFSKDTKIEYAPLSLDVLPKNIYINDVPVYHLTIKGYEDDTEIELPHTHSEETHDDSIEMEPLEPHGTYRTIGIQYHTKDKIINDMEEILLPNVDDIEDIPSHEEYTSPDYLCDTLPHKFGHISNVFSMTRIINPKSFENYTLSDIFIDIDTTLILGYSNFLDVYLNIIELLLNPIKRHDNMWYILTDIRIYEKVFFAQKNNVYAGHETHFGVLQSHYTNNHIRNFDFISNMLILPSDKSIPSIILRKMKGAAYPPSSIEHYYLKIQFPKVLHFQAITNEEVQPLLALYAECKKYNLKTEYNEIMTILDSEKAHRIRLEVLYKVMLREYETQHEILKSRTKKSLEQIKAVLDNKADITNPFMYMHNFTYSREPGDRALHKLIEVNNYLSDNPIYSLYEELDLMMNVPPIYDLVKY